MKRIGMLVALAAVAWTAPVHASPCGGSGSSSGGSSSGGSSSGGSSSGGSSSGSDSSSSDDSDSSSSASTTTTVPACVETSLVLGRRTCSRFGTWDVSHLPRFHLAIGSTFHRISLAGSRFDGTTTHDRRYDYSLDGNQLGVAMGGSFDLRATGMVGRHLYTGGEVSIGAIGLANPPDLGKAPLALAPRAGLYVASAAVLGTVLRAGDTDLRAEVAAGGRVLGLTVDSRLGGCEAQSTAWSGQALVEPRVIVDRWLSPWLTAGVMVGSNLAVPSDLSIGVSLTGHARAYDSSR
jgi:hypothetical protein